MESNLKNFLLVIKLFLFSGGLILFSQIIFGRGLDLDGVHVLYIMITESSFYYIETARIITHFFQQLPTWLFINFAPSNSINLLIKVFSFGLVWIHIVSILGCYFILPANKKYFLFFPLLAFIVGPVTALGVSISASLSVFSYIWFSSFVIYYSNLSIKIHKILFILTPLPFILSHEMMSYMSLFLTYLCLIKFSKETVNFNKNLIRFILGFLFIVSITSAFFIFFPEKSELQNRSDFFKNLFYLEFIFKKMQNEKLVIYPATLTSLFLLFLCFSSFFKNNFSKILCALSFILIIFFGINAFFQPFYTFFDVFRLTGEEEVRVWVSCFAMPLSLLLWWLFERKSLKITKIFFIACIFATLFLTGWRVGSDYRFYDFQKQFSKSLLNCKGIITWTQVSQRKIFDRIIKPVLFNNFNFSWKYSSSSLIYPRLSNSSTIVLSSRSFTGCYKIPVYGMCERNIFLKNNKFFNFDKIIYYNKNNISTCN